MIVNNLNPAYPTHPGEVLKDEIKYRGVSQEALAAQIGMSYKMLNNIMNAQRPISTETALRIEAAIHIPADSLLYPQMKYNMQTARNDFRSKCFVGFIPCHCFIPHVVQDCIRTEVQSPGEDHPQSHLYTSTSENTTIE